MTLTERSRDQEDEPDEVVEPFGQRGVLGAVGSALAKLSFCAAIIAAILWHRSMSEIDGIQLNPPRRKIEITSVIGRIRIVSGHTSDSIGGAPSVIQQRVPADIIDAWEDGPYKTLGIEANAVQDSAGRPITIVRISWRTIVILLLVLPAWALIRRQLRLRAERRKLAA